MELYETLKKAVVLEEEFRPMYESNVPQKMYRKEIGGGGGGRGR